MRVLKSLKEFKEENGVLDREALNNVQGGLRKSWTVVTNRNGCPDQDHMAQDYRWNGREYVTDGPAWLQDTCMEDVTCGLML